jgi:ABC-type transport system involved in multi-copper enzyme maturation permease subunit
MNPKTERTAFLIGALGLLACLVGALVDTTQFLRSYLWAYWFWLGAAIGCGQILMLYHLVGGAWGFVIQRILEAGLRTMPAMFVLVIPLVLGIPRLYSYADPRAVALDKALQHKSAYLNAPGVIVRLAIYFAIWGVIGYLMSYWSRRQDQTEDYKYLTRRTRLSAPGIVLFSLATSFAAVDWIMALEPDWYSTMFPGFYLVGQVLTAFAVAIVVLRFASEHPPLSDIISPKDFHDLGNLLLTFVILWAYVQVSQLIITWSGNLPKEIVWYLHRTSGNWGQLTLAIVLFHFAFPFFILLGRGNKLQSHRLAGVAAFVVLMHLVDNYWNVEPAFHSRIYVHWLDFAAPIGLGGIWVGMLLRQIRRYPLVPAHDPRVVEALEKAL